MEPKNMSTRRLKRELFRATKRDWLLSAEAKKYPYSANRAKADAARNYLKTVREELHRRGWTA